MTRLTLIPAYGRDYKSRAAVIADFDANKDFVTVGYGSGGNTNKQDLLDMGVVSVNIRYAKLTKVLPLYVIPGAST